jgi:hypothetical protein
MDFHIDEIIVKSALSALQYQRTDGSFPAGHNGPWDDFDTPARVTAHWSILFLKAYEINHVKELLIAAENAGNFLISSVCRPHGYSFYCRDGKNKCNGLIGQAWIFEALISLGIALDKQMYHKVAEEVMLQHTFHARRGLWYNLEIDGTCLGINRTLNQQVWFATQVFRLSKIMQNKILEDRARHFFRNLPKHIHSNGKYITHYVYPLSVFRSQEVARGYLSFLLTGLADAYSLEPTLIAKKVLKKIKKSLHYLCNNKIKLNNKYCWFYNVTGFEVAYSINTFGYVCKISSLEWAKEQLERSFDFKTWRMDKNTADANILASRVYEAARIADMK